MSLHSMMIFGCIPSGPAAWYFDKGTTTPAHNWNIAYFLGQVRLGLKDENVFINLNFLS